MSKSPAEQPAQHTDEIYEIRLRGHLDARWAVRLAVPSLHHSGDGTTTLRAVAVDQAALHGLLQRVRDLGLILVSVIRVPSGSDEPSNAASNSTRNPK
jgi:hypothetical protein